MSQDQDENDDIVSQAPPSLPPEGEILLTLSPLNNAWSFWALIQTERSRNERNGWVTRFYYAQNVSGHGLPPNNHVLFCVRSNDDMQDTGKLVIIPQEVIDFSQDMMASNITSLIAPYKS